MEGFNSTRTIELADYEQAFGFLISWSFIYVSQALAGEPVAAAQTKDGEWTLSFHAHPLGIIDTRRMKLVRRSAAPTKPLGAAPDA
ncbi:hypothetical protein [Mesorhizobium caraganae]|uniref:hypothetical protein n=1 Tax=Mesorhizobium caraganae TaxID=483206 RepID=UPI003ED07DE5